MGTVFLAFGITGDLMRLKGIPALFALYSKGALPANFRVVGLSRKNWGDAELRAHITEVLGTTGAASEQMAEFAKLFSLVQGEADTAESFEKLKTVVGSPAELVIYLCISPELYAPAISQLGAGGFLSESTHILIEKPFGSNLQSAQDLQTLLLHYLHEEQVFRIDHFLAKEAIQALANLQHADITSIEVYLNESLGVEKRGAMYDAVGALRDVGQNHLLEAAATVFEDRAAALESLHILAPGEIKKATERGQYEGYQAIEGVVPASQTETYFKIQSHFTREGRDIPLLLESGKRMPWRREVVITKGGGERVVIPFESGTNEYETLFAESFAGTRSRFVGMREVLALWRFTDPIEASWKAAEVPLALYTPHIE